MEIVETLQKKFEVLEGDSGDTSEVFRLLVESVQEYAIFMLDPQGYITSWNPGAERSKGYKAHEIIGKHFSQFYLPAEQEAGKPSEGLKIALADGKFEEIGWRVRKDGTIFWANVVITPVYKNEKLLGFAKVTRDLTERKKAEDSLRHAYAELEARVEQRTRELSWAKLKAENAIRERDLFFSVASHELQTPLASLKLQTQVRKRSVAKGDYSDFEHAKLEELCTDDERQIERLSLLVENMFDVAKITSGKFQLQIDECHLNEMIQQTLKRMSPLLNESKISWEFTASEEVRGQWDRLRLEQVLTNLISNACKFASGEPLKVTLANNSKSTVISVMDQGPGIASHRQETLFSPFTRVTDGVRSNGLGLGLYISKQIVEAHGGKMLLDSSLGRGAKFIIELPADMLVRRESHW